MEGRGAGVLLLLQLIATSGLLVKEPSQNSSKSLLAAQNVSGGPSRSFAFLFVGYAMWFPEDARVREPKLLQVAAGVRHLQEHTKFDSSESRSRQLLQLQGPRRPTRAFPSFLEHVYNPLVADGHHADVYVCVSDKPTGSLPPQVKGVFTSFQGKASRNQWDRLVECLEKVKEQRTYDFYVKTRPDLVFASDVNLKNLRTDRVYSRLRSFQNLAGLTTGMLSVGSWAIELCGPKGEEGLVGYVNDDQFFVAHASLWHALAVRWDTQASWEKRFNEDIDKYEAHAKWMKMFHNFEGRFTKTLLQHKVVTEPLDMVAFPVASLKQDYEEDWRTQQFTSRPIAPCKASDKTIEEINDAWSSEASISEQTL